MPVRKWDPLQDLILLQQDILDVSDLKILESRAATWTPAVDIYETEENFVLRVDLPGVAPEMIRLEFQNQRLLLSGERPAQSGEQNRRYHHVERVYGRFERIIALPPYVCCEDISATFKNGVLEISIPKAPPPQPKSIPVEG